MVPKTPCNPKSIMTQLTLQNSICSRVFCPDTNHALLTIIFNNIFLFLIIIRVILWLYFGTVPNFSAGRIQIRKNLPEFNKLPIANKTVYITSCFNSKHKTKLSTFTRLYFQKSKSAVTSDPTEITHRLSRNFLGDKIILSEKYLNKSFI